MSLVLAVEAVETRTVTTAATLPGATSLPVEESAGFLAAAYVRVDDITTGQSNRFQVDAVDTEAETITFVAPLPVAVSAGSILLAITANNVPVVDHFVTLEPGDTGQSRAQISSDRVRVLGSELVGANAILSEDGEWVEHVSDVPARVVTPILITQAVANQSIPNGTATAKVPDAWTVVKPVAAIARGIGYAQSTGQARVDRDGIYTVNVVARFAENGTGARMLRFVWTTWVGDISSEVVIEPTPDAFWPTTLQFVATRTLQAGEGWRMEVWQNSGGALVLQGGLSPYPTTTMTATYGGP